MTNIDDIFDDLIEKSKTIIKDDNRKELLPLSLKIQEFIIRNNIAINSECNEECFYQIVAYPTTNFIQLTSDIREVLVPELNKVAEQEYFVDNYVNKYITLLKYKGITLLKAVNIFYPIMTDKYKILSYGGKSRYNKADISYIHPKYNVENILSKLHNPVHYNDMECNLELFHKFLGQWKELGYNEQYIFKQANRSGTEILDKIEGKYILANVDFLVSNIIMSKRDMKYLKAATPEDFHVNKYTPFTMEDIRIKVIELTKKGKLQLKVWVMSNFTLIPIIGKKAHIFVNMRMLILEHIIQETVGNATFANVKLMIFNHYFRKYMEMKRNNKLKDLKDCEFIGVNHSIEDYLKQKRLKDKVKYFKKKQYNV